MVRTLICFSILLFFRTGTTFVPVVDEEKLRSYGLNDSALKKNDMVFLVNTINTIMNDLKGEMVKDLTQIFTQSLRDMVTDGNTLQLRPLQSSISEMNNDMCALMSEIQNVQKEIKELQKSAKEKSCAKGWSLFMNHYYFVGFGKTWEQAQQACKHGGGNLVKIENEVENWFLKNFVKDSEIQKKYNESLSTDHGMWIGAHRKTVSGQLVWVSDDSLVSDGFEGWFSGEPNNKRSMEGCGHLWKEHNYQWNDLMCNK